MKKGGLLLGFLTDHTNINDVNKPLPASTNTEASLPSKTPFVAHQSYI